MITASHCISLGTYSSLHCYCLINHYYFVFKDTSIIIENNTRLIELKSKNQVLESKVQEFENKLKRAIDEKKQFEEKYISSKNIGSIIIIILFI